MKHPNEEKTYVMIKPDGVRKGLTGEIIRRFEQRYLKIVALEMFQPSHDQMDNHYPKNEEWITRLGKKTLSTYEKYGYDAMMDFGTTDPANIGPEIRKWLIDLYEILSACENGCARSTRSRCRSQNCGTRLCHIWLIWAQFAEIFP